MRDKLNKTILKEDDKKATFYLYQGMKVALLMMIYDVIVANAAYGLALWLRFDLHFSMIP